VWSSIARVFHHLSFVFLCSGFGGVDHGSVDRGRGYKRGVGCRELIFKSLRLTSRPRLRLRLRLKYFKSGLRLD
jgi:hypothetical protein